MARKIMLYTGTIKTVFASDIKINKDKKVIPTIEREVVDDRFLLYRSFMNNLVGLENGLLYPDHSEAIDYLTHAIEISTPTILAALEKEDITEEEIKKVKEKIAKASSCAYLDDSSVKKAYAVTRQEFKTLKKQYKKKRV